MRNVMRALGARWLWVLALYSFALWASEAMGMGQDNCEGFTSRFAQCEAWIGANPATCSGPWTCSCDEEVVDGPTSTTYFVRLNQRRASDGALWSQPASFGATCPKCSTYPPDTGGAEGWTWAGSLTQTMCTAGCVYAPQGAVTEPPSMTQMIYQGQETIVSHAPAMTPTGQTCTVNAGEDNPDMIQPDDVSPTPSICQPMPGAQGTVCIDTGPVDGTEICATAANGRKSCIRVEGPHPQSVSSDNPPTNASIEVATAPGTQTPASPTDPTEYPHSQFYVADYDVSPGNQGFTGGIWPPNYNPDAGPTDTDDIVVPPDTPPDPCELNPAAPECGGGSGGGETCATDPTSEECVNFCTANPQDPLCTGGGDGEVDCDVTPNDPSCSGGGGDGEVDCDVTPNDPSCSGGGGDGEVDCDVTPNDPLCSGGGGDGEVDCDVTPNDPSCSGGGGDGEVDCDVTPNDPSCSGGGDGGDGAEVGDFYDGDGAADETFASIWQSKIDAVNPQDNEALAFVTAFFAPCTLSGECPTLQASLPPPLGDLSYDVCGGNLAVYMGYASAVILAFAALYAVRIAFGSTA